MTLLFAVAAASYWNPGTTGDSKRPRDGHAITYRTHDFILSFEPAMAVRHYRHGRRTVSFLVLSPRYQSRAWRKS